MSSDLSMLQRESDRIQAVNRFLSLNISKEKELQEIVELAARVCGTPTALLTFIDQDTQYIRFKQAFDFDSTPRCNAFCHHVIEGTDVMIVPDAKEDQRFANNPLVTGNPKIRFYAGSPLITQDGHSLGSLCVIDQVPGELSAMQQEVLRALSKQAIQLIEFDASLEHLKVQYEESKRTAVELRSFFESSVDCHLLLDKNFEILAFNNAWAHYVTVNYDKVLMRGASMTDYLYPENLDVFYKAYQKALSGTAAFEERKLRTVDGYKWRVAKFEPAFNEDGEIIGVSVNTTDITQKVEHHRIVSAQNDSLREIAFIQSHEVRRPVATILGLMELLRMDGILDSSEELRLLNEAVNELDEKIKLIISHTAQAELINT